MKQKLSAHNKGWLEAIIMGEGTLSVRKLKSRAYNGGYQFTPVCSVSNTDLTILRKIKNIVGDGSIVTHQLYRNDRNWKPSFKYQMTREKMRILLPQLDLGSKNPQKKLVLKVLRFTKGHKGLGNPMYIKNLEIMDKIVHSIRSMNNRGLNAEYNRPKEIVK